MLRISIPALSKIENGITDINLSRLEQVASILEVNVLCLFEPVDINEQRVLATNNQKVIDDKDLELASLQRTVILLFEKLRDQQQELLN